MLHAGASAAPVAANGMRISARQYVIQTRNEWSTRANEAGESADALEEDPQFSEADEDSVADDNEADLSPEATDTNRSADAHAETASVPTPALAQQAAQQQDPNRSPDSLFAGITLIHDDELSVGSYLASGAFGQVFRGKWKEEAVALKAIDFEHARRKLPLSEEDIAEALQWEVSRLAATSHPNLVQFHGLCRKGGDTYLVLEFCDGGSLQHALEQGNVSDARLWQWMREIAEALAYLHGQGMLHRDLKAENILIDRHGRAKLADLGVAQVDALLQDSEAKAVNMGLQDMGFPARSPEGTDGSRIRQGLCGAGGTLRLAAEHDAAGGICRCLR